MWSNCAGQEQLHGMALEKKSRPDRTLLGLGELDLEHLGLPPELAREATILHAIEVVDLTAVTGDERHDRFVEVLPAQVGHAARGQGGESLGFNAEDGRVERSSPQVIDQDRLFAPGGMRPVINGRREGLLRQINDRQARQDSRAPGGPPLRVGEMRGTQRIAPSISSSAKAATSRRSFDRINAESPSGYQRRF